MKQSIEEAAYDYATEKTKFRKDILKEVDADNYVSRHADCMEDFQCGAKWQTEQSTWISVKDRMPKKSISISKEQVFWLREMYETHRALLEGTPDDGNAAELKQVKKHVLPLIKELEKITK